MQEMTFEFGIEVRIKVAAPGDDPIFRVVFRQRGILLDIYRVAVITAKLKPFRHPVTSHHVPGALIEGNGNHCRSNRQDYHERRSSVFTREVKLPSFKLRIFCGGGKARYVLPSRGRSFDLAAAKSQVVVESVVSGGPIHLDIGTAEISELIRVQLDSDAQRRGHGINDTHGSVGPGQTALAGFHGEVVIGGTEKETLGGKTVDLNAFKILCKEAAGADAQKEQGLQWSRHALLQCMVYVSAVRGLSFSVGHLEYA